MKALILAAGLGTRLRPLTESRAKPSLPVLGVPIVWFPIWGITQSLPISDVFINGSHGWDSLVQALEDKDLKIPKLKMHLSDERDCILGSSGALKKVSSSLGDETLVVLNGDSICYPDLQKMLSIHKRNKSKLTLHLRRFQSQDEAYRNFKIDESETAGLVLGLGEKQYHGVMFSGTYLIEPELIKTLPDGISEFVPQLLLPLLEKNELAYYFENADWFDTGTIASFVETNKIILNKLPQLQPLIDKKTIQIKDQVWVSKKFSKNFLTGMHTNGFCYFSGSETFWKKNAQQYGPNFIGIEENLLQFPSSECIVLADNFCHISR